jgi:dienelactone hydrolase
VRAFALSLVAVTAVVSLAAAPGVASAQEPRDVVFRSTDGTELSGALYRSADDDAPVVMLFHQGRGSIAEYERIAPRLVAAGYHALAVDLRRGGDLFGVPNQTVLAWNGPEPSYCDVYQDLESTMQFAREIGLRGPLVAWGSSYSAALVIRLGAEYPEQIAAVMAFSPASGEPMAGCEPEPWAAHIEVPWLVVRPQREVENVEYPWIAEQLETFRAAGADTHVAPDSRHGSSMLDPERNPSDPEPTWAVVDRFLAAHAPASGRTARIGPSH